MKSPTWQEVITAMQKGGVLITWLDWDSNHSDPPQRWALDGDEIADSWLDGLPRDHIRTHPGGQRKPAIGYLTETGRAFQLDNPVELTLENVLNASRIDEVPGIEVPDRIGQMRDRAQGLIIVASE